MPSPENSNTCVTPILRAVFPHWSEEQLIIAQREFTRFLTVLYDIKLMEERGDSLDADTTDASLN